MAVKKNNQISLSSLHKDPSAAEKFRHQFPIAAITLFNSPPDLQNPLLQSLIRLLQMDLEEWEVLPRDATFFDFHGDCSSNNKNNNNKSVTLSPASKGSSLVTSDDFDMNYFICPKPRSGISRVVVPRNHLIPFQLEPEQEEQVVTGSASAPAADKSDQESVSQVFFKKETEFVDMKMDSPKSPTATSSPSPIWESPRFDSGKFSFAGDGEIKDDDDDEAGKEEDGDGGLNLWKWSLHGIGAICSFGFAAATVCIIIFGNHQRNKQLQQKQLRFQIYADDKRVKQVVQHATRFNDAMSAVRGVPIARAQVTFGGYYDAI
ncbi:hypothetical protein LINPERPRIM_LOCUS14313 [Linum perenne]